MRGRTQELVQEQKVKDSSEVRQASRTVRSVRDILEKHQPVDTYRKEPTTLQVTEVTGSSEADKTQSTMGSGKTTQG